MAIMINDAPRQSQRQQQPREGILELLARELATGAGQSLGTGLGKLATQGLSNLMDPNMRTMDEETLQMLGLDPQQAKSVARIKNPAIQREIINATQQRMADQQAQELKSRQAQQFAGALNKFLPQQQQQAAPGQPGMPGQEGQMASNEGPPPVITEDMLKDLELGHLKDIAKFGQEQQKMAQREQHAEKTDVRDSWKQTEKTRTKGREAAEEAEKSEGIVNRMEDLEKSGKLSSGLIPGLLEKAGLDALLNPEDQVFIKLRTAFMSGAKKAIGGRVTNFELDNFMKSVPSLMQSPEGRRMIIENMRSAFELDKQYYNTQREIIKEHQGKALPYDFDEQVFERMKPHYKKFQDSFKVVGEKPAQQTKGAILDAMPDPAANKGRKGRTAEGVVISDGTRWVPEAEYNKAKSASKPQASRASAPKSKSPQRRGVAQYY
jgi:hypothetical protein